MASSKQSGRRTDEIKEALRSPLLRVASTRFVTFPITVGCGLLWLRVVIGNVTTADYALVAIVVGFQFLLSFLDFGMTAHILDKAGRYAVNRDVGELGTAVGQASRTIVIGNVVVLLSALVVALAGAWGPIVGLPGRSSTVSLAVLLTLGINVLTRPLSLANSLVAGLGRPTVAQWAQVAASLISLGCAAVFVSVDSPLAWLVATPIIGQLLASSLPVAVAMRSVPGLLRAVLKAMVSKAGHTTNMRHLAAPMLLIQVIEPLNNQLDRVILSHFSTVEAVATYSLAAQFFASAMTVVASLFPTLWVQFAELRAGGGERLVSQRACLYVRRIWAPALALGAAFSIAVWFLGPIASAGKIQLSWTLCVALGVTFPFFAIRSIFGLSLTDPRGLKLQAAVITLTTGVNLTLTIALAAPLGALGPVLASLVAVAIDGMILAVISTRRLRPELPGSVVSTESEPENEAHPTGAG